MKCFYRHCEAWRSHNEAIHESKMDCHDFATQNLAMTAILTRKDKR
ncbi:hypothetical protein ACWIUD_09830 [Helicobacter sp. 23-1044]